MSSEKARIPQLCGFDCPHADFPPAETAGICRTMSAVWCGQLREIVNKNLPCEWRKRGKGATDDSGKVSVRPKRSGLKTSARRKPRPSSGGAG
jgi:hypothetical protein